MVSQSIPQSGFIELKKILPNSLNSNLTQGRHFPLGSLISHPYNEKGNHKRNLNICSTPSTKNMGGWNYNGGKLCAIYVLIYKTLRLLNWKLLL